MIKTLWIIGLVAGMVFVATDLVADHTAGGTWPHLLSECLVLILLIAMLAYSLKQWWGFRKKYSDMNRQFLLAHEEARLWQQKHQQQIQGLSQAIEEQMKKWALTESEQEVALLLIKGLSHKEIADARNSAEKTTRAQATAVYQKSGLNGRAELAAFFLEDLLSPSTTR